VGTPRARLAGLAAGAALVVAVAAWSASGGDGSTGSTGTTLGTAPAGARAFPDAAEDRLQAQGLHLAAACDRGDPTQARLLATYGAVLVAADDVVVPPTCRFADATAVGAYQAGVASRVERIGGFDVRLQDAALDALLAARSELRKGGKDLTPRAADAAWRDAGAVEALWRSRVDAGLAHWRRAGRLSRAEAARVQGLPAARQVAEILALEADGLAFGTHQDRPILQSVAAPGSSQHLAMLAFDVAQFRDADVIAALARHGWFRTVAGDEPHVTYLGRAEGDLPHWGLHTVQSGGVAYWVPDL
jgi:hypothetical protein